MNEVASIVHAKLRLGLVDFAHPVYLHIDGDKDACSTILVQHKWGDFQIIAMIGRDLTVTEKRCSRLEQLLLIA